MRETLVVAFGFLGLGLLKSDADTLSVAADAQLNAAAGNANYSAVTAAPVNNIGTTTLEGLLRFDLRSNPTTSRGVVLRPTALFLTVGILERPATLPRQLSPSEVFQKVAASILVVESLDILGKPDALGSAVCVLPGVVVTNAHVLEHAVSVRVRQGLRAWPASVAHLQVDHDLALMTVEGFSAAPVALRASGELMVGERVFAVGSPQGLELTLSEGLVSGLRPHQGRVLVQTSAPISPGSSGGGLFDEQGRLVGITTFQFQGQNLNFALPTEWLEETEAAPPPHTVVGTGRDQFLAWYWLARWYVEGRRDEAAVAALQKAIELKPNASSGWSELGMIHARAGRYEEAMVALRTAASLAPDLAGVQLDLCRLYTERWHRPAAETVQSCRAVTRLEPRLGEGWFLLGQALNQQGMADYELGSLPSALLREQATAFRRAVSLNPTRVEAWRMLAIVSFVLEDWATMNESCRKLLASDPGVAAEIGRLMPPSRRRCP